MYIALLSLVLLSLGCCCLPLQVLETLVRLKHKDPVLKQPDVVLFPQPADDDDDDAEGGADGDAAAAGAGSKKSKPVYLRTVLAKQVR